MKDVVAVARDEDGTLAVEYALNPILGVACSV